jgi:lysophospholipase L1-like esterase
MGGTNDFGGNPTPLGPAVYNNETHSFDTHTFQGSLAEVCRKIYARVPSIKIVLMSLTGGQFTSEDYDMPQRKNALGYTGLDYANATKEVADLLNLKYIDIWNDGINVFNRSLYISDTVHPNAEGAKLIASKVIFGLKDIAPVE